MNRWLLSALLPLSLQAADQVVVRSSIAPEQAWQGQKVDYIIEVLAKDAWAQIPTLPTLSVKGSYVLPPDNQSVRLQEQIEGAQYTGQRYQFSVYPQQGGEIEIPAFAVEVKSKVWGLADDSVTQQTIPPVKFTSKVPPGAEGLTWLVSSESFSATQSWSDETTEVKVGDALKRSVTLTANNVSGMAFKPLYYPQIDGLGVYPAEPSVEDKRDRGSLSGLRKEQVTYIFEGAGRVEIPPIELVWWDLKNQQLKKVVLEGRSIKVTGAPKSSSVDESITDESMSLWWQMGLGVLVLGLFWKRKPISESFAARKKASSEHEKAYFRRFMTAAASGDPAKTQAALMQWLDKVNASTKSAQLGPFIKRYSDVEWDVAALFDNPMELMRLMKKARNNWLKSQRVKAKCDDLLPKLNS